MLSEVPVAASECASIDDRYVIRSVVHAMRVMHSFNSAEALQLKDVVERSGLSKGVAFRAVQTLVHCGVLHKVGPNRYLRDRTR